MGGNRIHPRPDKPVRLPGRSSRRRRSLLRALQLARRGTKQATSARQVRRIRFQVLDSEGAYLMKLFGFFILFAAILAGSWKLQETNLLLGYTLGVFGFLGTTIFFVDYLARRYL